jgi:phosphoribosylformylglycinamidine synthase
MLLVAARGREEEIRRIFAKWDLDAVVIGHVTDDRNLTVRMAGAVVARVRVDELADGPVYEKPTAEPAWLAERRAWTAEALAEPGDYDEALVALVGSPTIASKRWAYRQYDQQVGLNTLVVPGSDAAVLRVKGTRRALAVSTDGNGRQVFLDPRRGAAMAVCEAARNVACAGGRPAGLTDCLNFGSPERPEILWQFAEAIDGIAEACRALDIPVVGGNVSFYNETSGQPILPTPVVGVVGVVDDAERIGTQWFRAEGHRIALLGPDDVSLGGSEYAWLRAGVVAGTLAPLDLEMERRVQAAVQSAVAAGLLASAHDCAEGGIAAALAESSVTGRDHQVGCDVTLVRSARPDVVLFGEGPSRIVVSVDAAQAREFEALMAESDIPWRWIGSTGGERIVMRVGDRTMVNVEVNRIGHAWRTGFERHVA